MRLRTALKHSRVFYYKKRKYRTIIYPKEKFWTRNSFGVYSCIFPQGTEWIEFSSEIIVKPVIKAQG